MSYNEQLQRAASTSWLKELIQQEASTSSFNNEHLLDDKVAEVAGFAFVLLQTGLVMSKRWAGSFKQTFRMRSFRFAKE